MTDQSNGRPVAAEPHWPWAAPLADHRGEKRRAERVLALTVAAIRRRVAAIEIIEDRAGGRLIVPALTTTILLAGLADRLASLPPWRWPRQIDRYVEAAIGAGGGASGLHLSSWAEVEGRVMVRVVPRHQAGPLAWPACGALWFDVVIALPAREPRYGRSADSRDEPALVIPDEGLIGGWARDPDQVRLAARANTRRLLEPKITTAEVGRLGVTILSGGALTAGSLIDVDYFLRRAAAGPGGGLGARTPAVAAALSPSIVVAIASPEGSTDAAGRLLDGWFANRSDGFTSNLLAIGRRVGNR